MLVKKLLLGIAVLFVFTLSEDALERKKPLPLKELQNPRSPSFVPFPYPKSDKEIVADLKYFFSKELKSQEKRIFSGKKIPAREKIMQDFLEGNDVIIGEILKIKNEIIGRERDYTFLVRLRNRKNIWLSNISLNSNGLFLSMNFLNIDELKPSEVKKCMIFKPYSDRLSIKEELKKSIGYDLEENEISKMQLVDGLCQIANSLYPAWEIHLSDGRTLIKSFYDNELYQVESIVVPNNKGNMTNSLDVLIKEGYQHFNRSTKSEVLILKKLEGQK